VKGRLNVLAETREVIVLRAFAQPELLETHERTADLVLTRGETVEVQSVLAPQAAEIPSRR
jgi:hypothetical protein